MLCASYNVPRTPTSELLLDMPGRLVQAECRRHELFMPGRGATQVDKASRSTSFHAFRDIPYALSMLGADIAQNGCELLALDA